MSTAAVQNTRQLPGLLQALLLLLLLLLLSALLAMQHSNCRRELSSRGYLCLLVQQQQHCMVQDAQQGSQVYYNLTATYSACIRSNSSSSSKCAATGSRYTGTSSGSST
jgi:hypothetical protein